MDVTKININSDTKQNNVIKINIYKTKQEYIYIIYNVVNPIKYYF